MVLALLLHPSSSCTNKQMMKAITIMIPANNINYNWNKYFTITEISKIIGVERSAVYRLIKNNKIIPSFGKPIKVSKAQLQKYVLQKAPHAPLLWEKDSTH